MKRIRERDAVFQSQRRTEVFSGSDRLALILANYGTGEIYDGWFLEKLTFDRQIDARGPCDGIAIFVQVRTVY